MSVFTEIDRKLRHSWLARAQPFIREKTPWLHQLLLDGRDLILPFKSEHGLTRYQHRSLERFFAFRPDTSGPVLEVGSDSDGHVVKELSTRGVRRVVGLNLDVSFDAHAGFIDATPPRYAMLQGDARALPFRDASISAILCITAFEHILDFDVALREMHRVLKPGGLLYSDIGPIWSCSIGHHVYAIVDGVEARHFKPGKNPVPHFGHLLMSREELRRAVLRKEWVFPKLADAIVDWIYVGHGINRLFFEDYVRSFTNSPFEITQLNPVREHVPQALQSRLQAACPGYSQFDVRMVEVVLRKQ